MCRQHYNEYMQDYRKTAEVKREKAFYPAHGPAQTAHFRAKARSLGLVMTGGSDFHDARYNRGGVGIEVDVADIQPFLDLVT
jgi:hypothetical protein